jgi:hypothetical protein
MPIRFANDPRHQRVVYQGRSRLLWAAVGRLGIPCRQVSARRRCRGPLPALDLRRHLGKAVALGCRVLVSRSGRSEPGHKCSRQLWVREVSRPGDMSVGTDYHGLGSSDLAKDR